MAPTQWVSGGLSGALPQLQPCEVAERRYLPACQMKGVRTREYVIKATLLRALCGHVVREVWWQQRQWRAGAAGCSCMTGRLTAGTADSRANALRVSVARGSGRQSGDAFARRREQRIGCPGAHGGNGDRRPSWSSSAGFGSRENDCAPTPVWPVVRWRQAKASALADG